MSAKEMFEHLGWYLDIESNEEQIVYSKNIFDKDTFGFVGAVSIVFEKESETITFDENTINLMLLQAINQQCKELGWID